jgi:hypothetical protein
MSKRRPSKGAARATVLRTWLTASERRQVYDAKERARELQRRERADYESERRERIEQEE